MKSYLSLLLSASLMLAACQTAIAPETDSPVETPQVETTQVEPINLIAKASQSGLTLTQSSTSEPIELEGVHPEQIGTIYNLGGDLSFAFVNAPNTWTALIETRTWEEEGNTAWSGLLIREFGGNWEPFFTIPDEDFNPVALILEGEQLILDAADDSGAGSGEGTLQRYVYPLGGVVDELLYTWQKLRCTGYYVPETYKYEAFSCE